MIVVGHNGAESGDDAAALGAQLARATGEPLAVVTVYPEENPIGVGRVDAEWVAYMREQAEEASASARRFLGERAEFRVVGSPSGAPRAPGSPAPAHGLDEAAEREQASMIVVGSSPRGARRRILPGSTGERLL